MRVTEPTCNFTLSPDTDSETISLTIENVDSDEIVITSTGDQLTTSYDTPTTITGLLTTTTTVTISNWYDPSSDLWFVSLSDNQARGTVESNPVFEDMLPMINRINPSFMTNSGDLVNGADDEDTLNEMFTAVLTSLEDSTVPMYPTPGNHDYLHGLDTYATYFGEPDYSYDYGPARLIALSTAGNTSRGTTNDEQLSWLHTLLTDTSLQTIVYFHHPLSPPSWAKSTCCFEDETERSALAEELDSDQVDFVLNGHSQGYEFKFVTGTDISSVITGFQQMITGSAGGNVAQPDGDYLFTLVHVTPTGVDHDVLELGDTNLAFDETNNNGRSDLAIITSEYSGAIDLPFLRLKFKLKSDPDADYLISDAAGNYLPFQSHDYGDYTVLLAPTDQTMNTTVDYTGQVASTLHVGTNQTANDQGHVQFVSTPTSTSADTHIQLTTSKRTATVSDLVSTDDGYSWIETPAARSVDSTYHISNLTTGTIVKVYLDGKLVDRVVANDHAIEFTLDDNARSRQIEVTITDPSVLAEIAVIPGSDGSAQLRLFEADGTNLGNWFAYSNYSGGFKASYGNVRSADSTDFLITRPDQKLGLFSEAGELQDLIRSDGDLHAGNVQGNSKEELLVEQGKRLRTYRWSNTKEQLLPLDSLRVSQLESWTLWNNQLVLAYRTNPHHVSLRRYRWENGWQLAKRKTIRAEQTVQMTQLNDDLLVVTNQLAIYNRKLTRTSRYALAQSNYEQVTVGSFTNNAHDTVCLLKDGIVYPLVSRSSGAFKALDPIRGNLHMMAAAQFSDRDHQSLIVTSNGPAATVAMYHYDDEANQLTLRSQFSAYGSTFPGSANLAIR
jgi:hypothetical protein